MNAFSRLSLLAILCGYYSSAYARDYFDPSLLAQYTGSQSAEVDLSQFEEADSIPPGHYLVDIYVNGNFIRSGYVTFINDKKTGSLYPRLQKKDLQALGMLTNTLENIPDDSDLPDISQIIPSAAFSFDFSRLQLKFSIPQAYMRPDASYMVDPALWDQGINAGIFNYSINGSHTSTDEDNNQHFSSDSLYLNLRPGLNIGPWRLRSNMNWVSDSLHEDRYDTESEATRRETVKQHKWSFLDRYVQRDIERLHGELTIGDTSTGNATAQVLDGFTFRGVMLNTQDLMIPAILRNYAPIVSGVANSNAQVTIRQNGYIIYQAYVAPGPFRITDLSGGSNAGDLDVTIKEADGSVHGFRQGYSVLPVMQRQGQLHYEVAAGKYRPGGYSSTSVHDAPNFMLASMLYGLPGDITAMGGAIFSKNYQTTALGIGTSLGMLGSLSASVAVARTRLPDDSTVTGQSYTVRYAKSVAPTGTIINLAAWRYATRHFYSFQEAVEQYELPDSVSPWSASRRRQTWQVSLDQALGGMVNLDLSGTRNTYWDARTSTTLSASLNGSLHNIGWSLGYSIDRIRGNGSWPENREFSFSLTVPLSIFSPRRALSTLNVNYRISKDSQGRVSNSAGITGSLLADNALSWYANQSNVNQGEGNAQSLGLSYAGSSMQMNAGYSRDNHSHSINYGASGGALFHRYGVTLSSQQLGEGVVLVHAPGISGAKVLSGSHTETNRWGAAVVPYVSPYARNSISIDPSTLPDGAELPDTSQNVYPTYGAVVLANYRVRAGRQVLMNIRHQGKPVPFGATVLLPDEDEQEETIVGDNGQVYLSGMPDEGALQVKWGEGPQAQCSVKYQLPPQSARAGNNGWSPLPEINAVCR